MSKTRRVTLICIACGHRRLFQDKLHVCEPKTSDTAVAQVVTWRTKKEEQ